VDLVTSLRQAGAARGDLVGLVVSPAQGLGVATGSPLYVIQLKGDTRQVVVGNEEDLYSKTMRVKKINLISVAELSEPLRVQVKIRHRHEPASAQLERSGSDEMLITFDQPQRAVTPGQAPVFYAGALVLGGGWIE